MYLRIPSRTSFWATAFVVLAGLSAGAASAASAFTVPDDRSLVYVLQGGTGQYAGLSVSVNGRILEKTSANTWFAFTAAPGRYDISTAASGRGNLLLTTEAGGTYYVYIQVNPRGAPVLRELDEATGARLLARHRALRDRPVMVKGPLRRSTSRKTASDRRSPSAVQSPHGLIVKLGTNKLSSTSQSFLGSTQDFDSTSKSVFALEYEYRFSPGFAVGAEIGKFSNAYTRTSVGQSGTMDVLHFSVKAKKYFEVNNWFHPFVGGGIGTAVTDFSGPISGGTVGIGLVGVGGAEFRFDKVGVYTELRYWSGKTSGEEEGTGSDVKVDVGGTGLNVGVMFHF